MDRVLNSSIAPFASIVTTVSLRSARSAFGGELGAGRWTRGMSVGCGS